MFSIDLVGSGSVSFDTDPDSGSSHFLIRIRIRIQGNDTDSTDPDPQQCCLAVCMTITNPKELQYFLSCELGLCCRGSLWDIPSWRRPISRLWTAATTPRKISHHQSQAMLLAPVPYYFAGFDHTILSSQNSRKSWNKTLGHDDLFLFSFLKS